MEENNESMTEVMKKNMGKQDYPPIKSIAIFRCEGGSEMRHLFPSIYSDILVALPLDVIDNAEVNDERKE